MAVRAKTITVNQTPAVAIDAGHSLDGARGSLTNTGASAVWVGGDDMAPGNYATNGIQVAAGAGLDDVNLPSGDQLFVFIPSGTGTVAVLVTGV